MMLTWIARGLGLLVVLFISMFALDVFNAGYTPTELAVALFMHLLPSALPLLVALLIAWRWPMAGSVLYACIGVFVTVFFNTYTNWASLLLISLPVFVLAALFYFVARRAAPAAPSQPVAE